MKNCIVITRFNLAIKFKYSRNDTEIPVWCDAPWLNEDYLAKRFDIFEKFTFSSLLGQTDKDFTWIVMFHKNTPDVFKEIIKQFTDKMPQMVALFFDDVESRKYKDIIRDYIKLNYGKEDVITVRIDNDDVIHKTFVEDCKKSFDTINEVSVLTYVNGYQYDSRNETIINYDYENNHFLSLFIPYGEQIEHILTFDHTKIDELIAKKGVYKLKKRTKVPMWIEIITQTNCANHMKWQSDAFRIPYDVGTEYSEINVKWKSKWEWYIYTVFGGLKTPFYYMNNIIRDIMGK